MLIQAYMYASAKACINDKNHLTAVDDDGYCKLCGYIESTEFLIREEVKSFMLKALDTDVESYIDSGGDFNLTTLAENAAFNFDNEAWLDDETHWVWDVAFEVTKEYRK